MNDQFTTIPQYVESKSTLQEKIVAYDKLITAMEEAYLSAAGSSIYTEVEMFDGQMKVKSVYRNPSQLLDAMQALEKIRQIYINRLNSRVTILRGGNL